MSEELKQLEEVKEEKVEVKQEESIQEELPKFLATKPGAPSQNQIDEWKSLHKDVFVSALSDDDLFVWRPLSRKEYVALQSRAADPKNPLDQFQQEEEVCNICVLFPCGLDWSEGKAGTANTLSGLIMQNSHFLNPAAASMLVAKL